jgi:hypothetical protein
MRYLVGFVLVVASVSPAPDVSAQEGEEGATPRSIGAEPVDETQSDGPSIIAYLFIPEHLQERVPGHHEKTPPPSKPPPAPLTPQERKVRGAKIGLGVSVGCALTGLIVVGAAGISSAGYIGTNDPGPDITVPLIAGTTIASAGAVSMIATGILLRVRKKELRAQEQAHHRRRRRAQWDLPRSRLVF